MVITTGAILIVALAAAAVSADAAATPSAHRTRATTGEAANASATLATVLMQVTGMRWGRCVARVRSALEAVPGAQQVEISLKQKEARVVYDTSRTTATALIEAVRDAGFEVKEKKWARA